MTPAQEALKSKIIEKMNAKYGGSADPRFAEAMAEAITEFFEGVHTTVQVTSVSGVTSGPSVSGPGTGTISFI